MKIPLRKKYLTRGPIGFRSRTNNKNTRVHGLEWHLNELLRKHGMDPAQWEFKRYRP